MADPHRTVISGAATGLTAAYPAAGIAIATLPDECFLDNLRGVITTIAALATSVTWFLAEDAVGDIPITDAKTVTISIGATTATKGGVLTRLERQWSRATTGTAGTIYLLAKTNVGTCTITPRLTYTQGG
jgi:hypothetical protein